MPKILIIDPSSNLAGFLKDILVRRGYSVHTTSNAAQGARIYRNQKPDLTLVGVSVRENEGWEALEKIRQQDAEARTAVLASAVSKEAKKKAADLGCTGYISKHINPEIL